MVLGGYTLLDTQFMTEHLRSFGALEISRADYRSRLSAALPLVATLFPAHLAEAAAAVELEPTAAARSRRQRPTPQELERGGATLEPRLRQLSSTMQILLAALGQRGDGA